MDESIVGSSGFGAWPSAERPPAGVRGSIALLSSVGDVLADERREFAKR
jgi:hypothetical protein